MEIVKHERIQDTIDTCSDVEERKGEESFICEALIKKDES